MDVIKCSKRSLNLIQPRAPLPPMTIPLITAEIKDAQEVDYHTDDEPSETSRPVTHDTDGASIENNESSQEKNEAILESKHKIQEKETDIKPPTVTFSKSIPKDASKMADKSRDRPPVESSFGTPRVPLPLGEVRRTQRRVAALLQQKPTGIVQPKVSGWDSFEICSKLIVCVCHELFLSFCFSIYMSLILLPKQCHLASLHLPGRG